MAFILRGGMVSPLSLEQSGRIVTGIQSPRVHGGSRDRGTGKQPLPGLIFQVDNVSLGSEIYYCAWYQGILGLSQSASAAQRVAKSARCRTIDFGGEV